MQTKLMQAKIFQVKSLLKKNSPGADSWTIRSTILPGDGHCHSKCIVSVIMYRMSCLLITNVQSNMLSKSVVAIRTFYSVECMVSTFEGFIVKNKRMFKWFVSKPVQQFVHFLIQSLHVLHIKR